MFTKNSPMSNDMDGRGEGLSPIRPLDKPLLARNPITRSRGKFRVMVPAPERNRMIKCESILERNAVLHFRFSPAVVRISEQPFRTSYYLGSKRRTYTPDFVLEFVNGHLLYIEVKPLSKAERPEWKEKLIALKEQFESDGRSLVLVTDMDVNHKARLTNLNNMRIYCQKKIPATQVKALLLAINNESDFTVQQAITSGLIDHLSDIYTLLANHKICVDLNAPINRNSILNLPKGNYHESLIFSYRAIN